MFFKNKATVNRFQTGILLTVWLLVSGGAVAQQKPGGWQIVPFINNDSVSCYLRYRSEVGPLDEHWMEVVMVNRTPRPKIIGAWQLSMVATVEGLPDTILPHWGKVDFTTNDSWMTANTGSAPGCFRYGMCIPPNDSVVSGFLAEFATSYMLDNEIGPQWKPVKPFDRTYRGVVHVFYTEGEIPFRQNRLPDLPVSWHWRAVREEDFPGLVRRLDQSLNKLQYSATSKLLQTLLTDPRIYGAFPLDRYNRAIMGLEEPFCRQTLLRFLNSKFPENEVFREYIVRGIERNDPIVMQTIYEGYWHESMLEPLFKLAQTRDVLPILQLVRNYKKDFCSDRNLTARFARLVFDRFRGMDWLENPDPAKVYGWYSFAQTLALTCDSTAIAYFERSLAYKDRFKDYTPFDFSKTPPYLPPMRVCDFALESIWHIKGYNPETIYLKAAGLEEVKNQAFVRDFYHPRSLNNRAFIESIRDTLVARYPQF